MTRRRLIPIALLATTPGLLACSSTRIVESWKAPGAEPPRFEKVLALAIVEDPELRRNAEDALAAALTGVRAVRGYEVLAADDLADRDRAKERVRQQGLDGVVALRLVSSEEHMLVMTDAMPAPAYESFWGYEGAVYPPTDMSMTRLIRIEIRVYSLTADRLLWSGVSESFDPVSVERLVDEIVAAARAELRRQQLIP